MGYKSSEHGVRSYIERNIEHAITRCHHPSALVEDMGIPKERASVIIDGNIAMFAVPNDVKTLDAYADYLTNHIREYLRSFGQVILLFDEPTYVPKTKGREQRGRDAHQARALERETGGESPGFVVELAKGSQCVERYLVCDDSYTVADLVGAIDCHQVMRHRASRTRFIDEVMRRMYDRITLELQTSNQLDSCCLALSGIDLRGAGRPKDLEREPHAVCSNASSDGASDGGIHVVISEILSSLSTIGEGDIKMRVVDDALRALRPASLRPELIAWVTTDFDSLGIGILHVAKLCERRMGDAPRGPDFNAFATRLADDELLDGITTVICAHEQRATCLRRARELQRQMQPVQAPVRKRPRTEENIEPLPSFQVFEPKTVLQHFCESACSPQQTIDDRYQLPYASLASGVVAAFALGGCDFVTHTTPQKATVFLKALMNVCKRQGGVAWLDAFALPFDKAQDVQLEIAPRLKVLQSIVNEAADITFHGGARSGNNRVAHEAALRALCDIENENGTPLRNAAWAVRYWSEEGICSGLGSDTPNFGQMMDNMSAWGF